uniref:hypothetical protein n=1 Tax=Fushitsunagia catenata TaxID=1827018 RepID=UPI0026E2CAB8|nr:hypothetical protein Q6B41_mgp04 [Fushitsunagia catenata]WJJ67936.1 hypothetical protein [Fushitsunagia catenata]
MKIRLENYYKQVGNFDFFDKSPVISSTDVTDFKIIALVYPTNTLNQLALKNILMTEFVCNQKIKLNYSKIITTIPFFLILNNQNAFLFLEFCLNSFFKDSAQSLKVKQFKISINPISILQNSLISQLDLNSSIKTVFTISFSDLFYNKSNLASFYYFKY